MVGEALATIEQDVFLWGIRESIQDGLRLLLLELYTVIYGDIGLGEAAGLLQTEESALQSLFARAAENGASPAISLGRESRRISRDAPVSYQRRLHDKIALLVGRSGVLADRARAQ
jgi:hypothetical protein